MPETEITVLLSEIREQQIRCSRVASLVKDSRTRTSCIMMYTKRIAQARTRIIELVGFPGADMVDHAIDQANVQYAQEQRQGALA